MSVFPSALNVPDPSSSSIMEIQMVLNPICTYMYMDSHGFKSFNVESILRVYTMPHVCP